MILEIEEEDKEGRTSQGDYHVRGGHFLYAEKYFLGAILLEKRGYEEDMREWGRMSFC